MSQRHELGVGILGELSQNSRALTPVRVGNESPVLSPLISPVGALRTTPSAVTRRRSFSHGLSRGLSFFLSLAMFPRRSTRPIDPRVPQKRRSDARRTSGAPPGIRTQHVGVLEDNGDGGGGGGRWWWCESARSHARARREERPSKVVSWWIRAVWWSGSLWLRAHNSSLRHGGGGGGAPPLRPRPRGVSSSLFRPLVVSLARVRARALRPENTRKSSSSHRRTAVRSLSHPPATGGPPPSLSCTTISLSPAGNDRAPPARSSIGRPRRARAAARERRSAS